MKLLDFKVAKLIPLSAYVKQSLMATLFLTVFLLVWHYFMPVSNLILFSSVASSTFLTFLSTNIYDSLSSKILGGQIIGVLIGAGLWFGLQGAVSYFPDFKDEAFILAIAVSTGLCVFVMSILDFEHPPAAGTAMAFVFHAQHPTIADALFIVICSALLSVTHYWLKKRRLLKDLD